MEEEANGTAMLGQNEWSLVATFIGGVGSFVFIHSIIVSRSIHAYRTNSKRAIGAATSEVVVIRSLLGWLQTSLLTIIALELPILYEYIAHPRRVVVPGNGALMASASTAGIAILGLFAVYRPMFRILFVACAGWSVVVYTVFEALVDNHMTCIQNLQCPSPGPDDYNTSMLLALKVKYLAAIVLYIWVALDTAYIAIAWGLWHQRYGFQEVVFPETISGIPAEIRASYTTVQPARATRRLSKELDDRQRKSLMALINEHDFASR